MQMVTSEEPEAIFVPSGENLTDLTSLVWPSKGALISLTKSLSSELAGQGILVNCVAPGWIATDMSAPALATEGGRNRIFATIPLGRVATTSEIAGPIVFLCSPWAGFISGEVMNVNGGAVLVG